MGCELGRGALQGLGGGPDGPGIIDATVPSATARNGRGRLFGAVRAEGILSAGVMELVSLGHVFTLTQLYYLPCQSCKLDRAVTAVLLKGSRQERAETFKRASIG